MNIKTSDIKGYQTIFNSHRGNLCYSDRSGMKPRHCKSLKKEEHISEILKIDLDLTFVNINLKTWCE